MSKQRQINMGTFDQRKTGRKKKHANATSDTMRGIIAEKIKKDHPALEATYRDNPTRQDNLRTRLYRSVRDLCNKFLDSFGTKNKYKKGDIKEYAVGFAEAFWAFASIETMLKELSSVDLFNYFLDFIAVKFSETKVMHLFEVLEQEGFDKPTLDEKRRFLRNRDKISKKYIISWMKESPLFKSLAKFYLESITFESDLEESHSACKVVLSDLIERSES